MKELNNSTTFYNKLNSSHKLYAKRILHELYPDKTMNIQVICSKFAGKYRNVVIASIKDLENCKLICRADENQSKYSEKTYKLTKHGTALVEEANNENVDG